MMNAELGQGQGREPGVGALLRASRLRCGEDLRDVATLLRIRYPFLEAIEEGRYGDLPGSAYAVGFVRTYAEHLGLDSKEVVRRFKAETENSARRTALDFPTPVAERSTPGGAVVFVGILVAAVAYGAWYLGTSKNSFLVDLVAPLPGRLAALVHGDEAGTATSEAPQPAIQPLNAEAGSPGSPGSPGTGPADRPATASETAAVRGAPETQTASATAEPPAPAERPATPVSTRPEPAVDADRTALTPPKPVPPVAKVAPPKPIAVPKPVPMPVASAPATPTPAAAPTVAATAPAAPATAIPSSTRSESEAVKPPVPPAESRSATASSEPPASPRPAVATAPSAPAAPTPPAGADRPTAAAQTPTVTASNVSPPAPAAAPTLGAIPAVPSPEPKPATPVAAVTQPTAGASETPKPPSAPAAPAAAVAPPKPVTPATAPAQASQSPAAQVPAAQVAAIPAAPEVASAAAPQGSSAAAPVKASRIVVRAKLDSWIQVRDGVARRLLVTRLLRAGDTYRVPDQAGLSLLTGNAGALEIVVDGEVVPSIGEVGVVRRDVVLDADKLKAGAAVVD